MNTILKVNSNEGGQFNASNNHASFDIPANQVYDLSKSYLNLVMSCDVTAEQEVANGNGTYIPVIEIVDSRGDNPANTENIAFDNSVLLRRCKLDSELKGNIEHLTRSDILSHNLNSYSKSQEQRQSEDYEKLIQPFMVSRTKPSIFTELHKEGNILSRNKSRVPVRVPLHKVMNFFKQKQYDTGHYGKTRLEVELNTPLLATPTQYLNGVATSGFQLNNDNAITGGASNSRQNRFMNATQANVVPFGNPISQSLDRFYVCIDPAPAGGLIPRIYNRLEDSILFTNQKLAITATYAGGGGRPNLNGVVRRIVALNYNRGDGVGQQGGVNRAGCIEVVLNLPIHNGGPLGVGESYTNISFVGDTCTFGNGVVIDFAELVLEQLAPQNIVEPPKLITYKTYTTEEVDNNSANFQHTFLAEPNAINLYVMSPTNNLGRTVSSRLNGITDYRMRIDNKDASNRQIRVSNVLGEANDPLHIIKQNNALVNSDRVLTNYSDRLMDSDGNNSNTGMEIQKYATPSFMIGQVLPFTASNKQIQLEINSNPANQNFIVFKEVVREI